MKYVTVLAFSCLFLLSSCEKEGLYTQTTDSDINQQNSALLKTGGFYPTRGITVSGSAEIRKNASAEFVNLANFSVSSGPDLKVYLSKKDYPSEYVNLGPLENNKTTYRIPEGAAIEDYPYVLIHCQQYNHLFAIANLK
jgi:Electron transfer DM13